MSAHPRLPPGQPIYWQRPPGTGNWHTDGIGIVHTDHGRTVTLTDRTLLLRNEIHTILEPYWRNPQVVHRHIRVTPLPTHNPPASQLGE